jgi:uncharacterized protein YdeI (YjbR/CyaY-like superfamily)
MIKESAGTIIVYVPDRAAWRAWLELNHLLVESIWLVQHRKSNKQPCVTYEEVVLEALCFGWIDSRPRKLDDQRFLLFLFPGASQRAPGASATNAAWRC